ncbi:hypothetical protein KY092_11750 [Natronomonas gomsonensis]|uniref:hypothetical protein n=1 Tax=Natronomonas gomsonensis TaxID=1046043 RepID=UPI0020CA453D|nr:hypothetical protein [Natronomonas gomsonensis]MCY4731227.1 hypothetical protein [Natronomonas gomsonensis]
MRGNGSFVDDQRGVSAVLGFVLMFALVMTTFAIYQSDVVPHQNAEVESSYSQSLDGEVSELRSTTMDVAANGASASETIQGAPDYPDRALGINAPPPKSRLSTTAEHDVSIAGLESAHKQYWDGTERTFETRLLAFEPSYNYIRTEETYYLANGVGVHESGNGSYASSVGGEVVDCDQIDIVLFDGDVDQQASVHDVSLEPVSTNSEYHSVTPEDDASIELPTVRSESAWTEIAADNPNVNDTEVTCGDGSDPPCDARVNTVEIELNDSVESYDFRVTKVSLEEPSTTSPEYITTTSNVQSGLSMNQTHEIEVTARDKYGNPTDAEVELVGGGDGTFRPDGSVRTGGDMTTFKYEPGSGASANFKARINNGNEPYQRLDFSLGSGVPGPSGKVFEVYNDGQLYTDLGEIESMYVSDIYATESSSAGCLLGDIDEGLLGLLSGLTCIESTSDVSQFTATLHGESTTYEVGFTLVDEDQDGHIFTGSGYDGDDYAAVMFDSDDSLVDDEPIFVGKLEPGTANHLFVTKQGEIDLLDESSYQSTEWERRCSDTGLFGLTCTDYEYGITSFDEFMNENIDAFYVDHADGHATVEVSS